MNFVSNALNAGLSLRQIVFYAERNSVLLQNTGLKLELKLYK